MIMPNAHHDKRTSNRFGSRRTGFSHLLSAGRYSASGARVLAKETAAKHEALAFLALLVFLYLCDARFSDYLIVSILFLILISIEALNTSIEHIVDLVSPQKSDLARSAKDLGSLAVFFNLCAGGVYLLAVLARTLGWIDW